MQTHCKHIHITRRIQGMCMTWFALLRLVFALCVALCLPCFLPQPGKHSAKHKCKHRAITKQLQGNDKALTEQLQGNYCAIDCTVIAL